MRMLSAYILSLGVAYSVGYIMARNRLFEKFLMPFIDILQSVPILTFFPVALYVFIQLAPTTLGPEIAVVFLIFTSMVWNLIFAVYESLLDLPLYLKDVSKMFGMNRFAKLFRIYIPLTLREIIPNSMVSWANGWYFLIATEIIVIGSQRYELKGIGSYLMNEAIAEHFGNVLVGIAAVTGLILFMNLFIWKPILASLSLIFSGKKEWNIYDYLLSPLPTQGSFVLRKLKSIWAAIYYSLRDLPMDPLLTAGKLAVEALLVVLFVVFLWHSLWAVAFAFNHLPKEAPTIPLAFVLSFLRIMAAFVLSLLWTLPVAYLLRKSPKIETLVLPLFEVLAAIPVTALFPILIILLLEFSPDLNFASVVFLMTGMQWYLFFNIYGGLRSLPAFAEDLKKLFRVSEKSYIKNVIFPGILPLLVVGAISAIGGGWNAVIVAEFFQTKTGIKSVLGIGSLMDKALYSQGSLPLLVLTALSVGVVIPLINIFIWRPIMKRASAIGGRVNG